MTPPPEAVGAAEEALAAFQTWVEAFPRSLAHVPAWQAALAVPVGLVSLLYGLKLFKGMVVIYAAMVGVLLGEAVAAHFGLPPVVGMIVGGTVLAAVAWPLLRYAVGLFGGVAGGLLASMVAYSMAEAPWVVLVAGAVGFAAGVLLAALVFRAVIIFTTAVLGAHLVVVGVVALLSLAPDVGDAVMAGIEARRIFLPVLVGVPALVGILYQAHQGEPAEKGGLGRQRGKVTG